MRITARDVRDALGMRWRNNKVIIKWYDDLKNPNIDNSDVDTKYIMNYIEYVLENEIRKLRYIYNAVNGNWLSNINNYYYERIESCQLLFCESVDKGLWKL